MADTAKLLLDALRIPEPSSGFEQRIMQAANAKQKRKIILFRPRGNHGGTFARPLMTAVAALAVLWLMPNLMLPSSKEAKIYGVPILADVFFEVEADEDYVVEEGGDFL